MKLIHTGDWHLDARMETGLTPTQARTRRKELLTAFSEMAAWGEKEGVRAILLAGDLFDSSRAGPTSRRLVGEVMEQHPGIAFISVNGNHDRGVSPLFSENSPASYTEFPSDGWGEVLLAPDVSVCGTGALGIPGIYDRMPPAGAGVFRVVMLHGQVATSGGEQPDTVPLPLLRDRGIDYLALGHFHTRRVEKLDRRGQWAYCGCPQGRGFDECGEKGFLLLDTERPPEERLTFVPLPGRRFHEVGVDLTGETGYTGMKNRILEKLSGIPAEDMVKIVLEGELPPETDVDETHLEQEFRPMFYLARLENRVKLLLRPQDYIGDISLKGELIRTVLATGMTEEEKQRVILCALRALRGEDVDA